MEDDFSGDESSATDPYSDDDDLISEPYSDRDDADADDLLLAQSTAHTVLSESDIKRLQDIDIADLSATISVSGSDSCAILRHCNWNVSRVHDEWFSDESRLRTALGLVSAPSDTADAGDVVTCRICFDPHPSPDMPSAGCGHKFCRSCWIGYVTASIDDGPGCLSLRCPDPSCSAAVGLDMVRDLASDEHNAKYSRYLLRTYVERNKSVRWCPAPGCEHAVMFGGDTAGYDVACRCGHAFCWNCSEEAHRPVACDTVAKWILKNSSESENTNWILANSKPCPRCKYPIEKNQGCMHMMCRPPCCHQFCWLCLGPWEEHGEQTGGHYACNRYEEAKERGECKEEEARRERAKNSITRYTHYYERWASNQSSMKKAVDKLEDMRAEKLERLRCKLVVPSSEVQVVVKAWEQIIECRRILAWTYPYGYFLPKEQKAKKELFEYLQGQAEAGLERLHKCAEIDLKAFFDMETLVSGTSQEFVDYKIKLAGLTTVTRNYFENLVQALENGLQEVEVKGRARKAKKGKGGAWR